LNADHVQPGFIYLQVFASREPGPAQRALSQMIAKGHPVAVDNLDPSYYRIVIGPFAAREEADAYLARLKAEGTDAFLRKF
jgi:cell division protein FtsN